MEPKKEEPYFNFLDTDWNLIKRGLAKLPFEEVIDLLNRMGKHEHAMQEYEKPKNEPEK